MSLTPALLQPFLALLLLTASPVSSQSTIQSLNDLILDTTTNNNNNNHNNHNNPGWTTTLPESMQPPPLISPLSAPSSLKPPTILHHDIPPYCGPSAVALSIDLRPDNPSSNTSLQLPSLLSLLGACSWLVTNDTNRPQVDIDLPAIASKTGYFACGVPDTGGPVKVYLTVRYVQQAPEVPGRVFYTYLSTLLRGLGDWAVLRGDAGGGGGGGIPQGNMAVSKTDKEVLLRDVFVARIGVGLRE